jgi:lipopolysaccharide export system permease protein
MSRLDRYIGRAVLAAMTVVLLVLAGLELLFTIVDELGETAGQYHAAAALQYVALVFPRHLYELLPMTALIGALAGLGMLAGTNELVAMRAAGVARARIVLAVMKPAGLVMLLGLVLGEWIAPPLEVRAEVGKALASGEQVALSRYGHWERDGAAFMHFNAIEPQGILHGVTIFEFDDSQRMVRNVAAERAVWQGTEGSSAPGEGAGWVLQNGTDTRFVHTSQGAQINASTQFAAQDWPLDLTPELLQVLIVDPDRMAISDLYRYARRFERQGQDASQYFLAFWKKLLQPLTTGVLVLLAISFIFGPLREATMGSRVFTAICFGLAFTILQRLLQTVSLVYQFDPLLAVLLPLLVCLAAGVALLRRAA